MTSTGPRPRLSGGWILDTTAFLLIGLHVALFSLHTDRAARALDARVTQAPPAFSAPRFFLDNDSYAWLAHARELMESDDWRIRHTFMDNAPFGRPLHWSHPLLWSLQALASLFQRAFQWPAARALDLAGVCLMPLFQFLVLSSAFCLFRRVLGWGFAALFTLLALSLEPLAALFHPLSPDHHGLQAFSAFLAFFCLVLGGMGWIRTNPPARPPSPLRAFLPLNLPSLPDARRWFVAAGFFGAIGLWLGATVWILTFAFMVASSLIALPPWRSPPDPHSRHVPGLWRLWAVSGALFATIFYLLEYAPHPIRMRLEVNHPLYALAWLGVAEGLVFLARAPTRRFWQHRSAREWILLASGLAAVLAPVLALSLGPVDWHLMRHPILFRMSNLFTEECTPGLLRIRQFGLPFVLSAAGLLPLAVFSWLIRPPDRPRHLPACAALGLYVLLFAVLFLRQLRWLPFFVLPLAAFATLPLALLLARHPRHPAGLAVTAGLLLNVLLADGYRWRTESRIACADHPPEKWAMALAAKHTALHLGAAADTNSWRLLGTFDDAPKLFYFTGIPSVASFYWENLDGWQAETAFYNDRPDGETAPDIARTRGLTHALALPPAHLHCMLAISLPPPGNPLPDATLAECLAAPPGPDPLPPWLHKNLSLSSRLSARLLLQTETGLVHLQRPFTVFSLRPPPPPLPP